MNVIHGDCIEVMRGMESAMAVRDGD